MAAKKLNPPASKKYDFFILRKSKKVINNFSVVENKEKSDFSHMLYFIIIFYDIASIFNGKKRYMEFNRILL